MAVGDGGCSKTLWGVRSAMPDGRWTFTEELTAFAEACPREPSAHIAPIIERLRRPVRVAVSGRQGVGRGTVEAALRARGVRVVDTETASDVRVLVIAEAFKPEDGTLLATHPQPTLIVLTKADLSGSGGAGPLANATRRAEGISARTGAPVVAMIGLLATGAALDESLIGALRTLVAVPADLSSVDRFVTADHPVDRVLRARLLDRLDRFGIAHAVLALAEGADPAAVEARLQKLSNVDGVLAGVHAAGAPARYLRTQQALTELRWLAVASGDDAVADFLTADATAMAVMASAVDVVEAASGSVGSVDRGDGANAHARRAVRWHRYARGPVSALHRECAADIVRGSLRLLDQVGTIR